MPKNIKIQRFNEFKKLYIFDFDDTLVESPSFEKTIIKYLKENITSKSLLDKSLKFISKDIKDLNYENGRIYIDDPNKTIDLKGNWVRKKERVYLTSPYLFSYIEESLPTIRKELSDFYNSLDNKCIITARPETIRNSIEKTMKKLNLDYPKYGLHMRPEGRKNAGQWKGEKIVELVNKYGFSSAVFYDDNSKYIKNVKKVLKEKMPNFNFNAIKVSKN